MEGYKIAGHDNDSYAFYKRTDVKRCPVCNALIDKWSENLSGLIIKNLRRSDISATYDGVLVVSARFKDVCEQSDINGTVFLQLPDDPTFFRLDSENIVAFNSIHAKTRFIKQCNLCKIYESVVGTNPFKLMQGQTIKEKGFSKTDLEFGSLDEKHPIIICDNKAGEILKKARLKGLELLKFTSV
jgi:hypothetical protein